MQIRALFVSAVLAVAISFQPAAAATVSGAIVIAAAPAMFGTEAAARRHCPRDVVVWLNIPTHIYHEKGMRWYARTKHRAYVCKREADAAGDRNTRNGQ